MFGPPRAGGRARDEKGDLLPRSGEHEEVGHRAEVIQVFCPEITHSFPSRRARVAMAERSLPAPGSVKQMVPTRSPASAGRRNSSRIPGSPER
jgi:hypothetical protein